MKLGISYIVFDAEELLEFAIKGIRDQLDFISVVYQSISFHGNQAKPELVPKLEQLLSIGLIDKLVHYQPDLNLKRQLNEVKARNLGLEQSKEAGCTHHISADVDEFYVPEQLAYAKKVMESDYDSSIISITNYFKHPTFQITPSQNQTVSFIHPVTSSYSVDVQFPSRIDATRKLTPALNCKVFSKDEFMMHHMSFVRKNIAEKFDNSLNTTHYDVTEFMKMFNTYQLGDRLKIAPDFINRRTVLTPNIFGINIED
jgi:hypothetical protein